MTAPRQSLTAEVARYVLPAVQFHGLSMDAADAAAVARFWSVVLGGSADECGNGRWQAMSGPGRPAGEFMRVNTVREPRTVDTRVHVDISLPGNSPQRLLAAGATLLSSPDVDPWYVLSDPESNAFCAYPAVDDRPPGIFQLVVRAREPHELARWWGDMLGGVVSDEGEAAAVTGVTTFPWDYMVFDLESEPKSRKNRLHWHVQLRDPTPSYLVTAGATILQNPTPKNRSWILADPEGNEFCATVAS